VKIYLLQKKELTKGENKFTLQKKTPTLYVSVFWTYYHHLQSSSEGAIK
jgi:hypothetical protein